MEFAAAPGRRCAPGRRRRRELQQVGESSRLQVVGAGERREVLLQESLHRSAVRKRACTRSLEDLLADADGEAGHGSVSVDRAVSERKVDNQLAGHYVHSTGRRTSALSDSRTTSGNWLFSKCERRNGRMKSTIS